MKKVLVLSNMYPGEKSPTFGIFIRNQVQLLRDTGLDVDVLAIKNPKMDRMSVLIKYMKWLLSILFNFILRGRKYDIIHVHYVFPTGVLGLLYKKVLKKPMIVTAHGGDIDRMAKRRPIFRSLTSKILKEADYVIAVGENLYQTLNKEYKVPEDKLSVLNMGVDINKFTPIPKEQAKKEVGLALNEEIILFVGNLIKQKGVLDLIKAFEKTSYSRENIRLILIGHKKDLRFFREIQNYIKVKRLDKIEILNPKSQNEIMLWMNAANVFVLPSHFEGLGLVALEAMACGTPVIGTKVGGLQYILNDGAGLLVEVEKPEELAQAISNSLEDKLLTNSLIEAGLKRARGNDSLENCKKLIRVYLNIIEKHSFERR